MFCSPVLMNSFCLFTLFFGLLFPSNFFVFTYKFVIEKPSARSIYWTNEKCLVRWNRFEADPIFSHIDIELAHGSHNSYTIYGTVANNFDIRHTHFFRFKTPKKVHSDGNYFLIFKAIGADYETFSPVFKIISNDSD